MDASWGLHHHVEATFDYHRKHCIPKFYVLINHENAKVSGSLQTNEVKFNNVNCIKLSF